MNSIDIFIKNLKDEIKGTLSFSIDKKTEKIYLNDIEPKQEWTFALFEYKDLKPFYKSSLDVKGVNVKIYAGVGKQVPIPGWYIYCNERLVLEKIKPILTG